MTNNGGPGLLEVHIGRTGARVCVEFTRVDSRCSVLLFAANGLWLSNQAIQRWAGEMRKEEESRLGMKLLWFMFFVLAIFLVFDEDGKR